jgi:predicted nucleic acid-binding protein
MPLYLDADAVVKRYVNEGDGGTAVMDALFAAPLEWGGFTSSEWMQTEVTATLAKKVREGKLRHRKFEEALADFRAECGVVVTWIGIEAGDVLGGCEMLRHYAHAKKLQGGDAVHLHTAETLWNSGGAPFALVTCDSTLTDIARLRGLPTFNPVLQPLSVLNAIYNK